MALTKQLNISCLSVGHRPTLIKHHDSVLQLDGKGNSTITPVEDFHDADIDRAIAIEAAAMEAEQRFQKATAEEGGGDGTNGAAEGGAGAGAGAGAGGGDGGDGGAGGSARQEMRSSRAASWFDAAADKAPQQPGLELSPTVGRHSRADIQKTPSVIKKSFSRKAEDGKSSMFDVPGLADAQNVAFDGVFLRRFWRLVRSGFPTLCSKPVAVLLMSFMFSIAAQLVAIYLVGCVRVGSSNITPAFPCSHSHTHRCSCLALFPHSVGANMFGAIIRGHWAVMRTYFFLGLVACAVSGILQAAAGWVGQVLSLYWYKAIVDDAHAMYFESKVAYALNNLTPSIDNFDQRLAADAFQLTSQVGWWLRVVVRGAGAVWLTWCFDCNTVWYCAVWISVHAQHLSDLDWVLLLLLLPRAYV